MACIIRRLLPSSFLCFTRQSSLVLFKACVLHLERVSRTLDILPPACPQLLVSVLLVSSVLCLCSLSILSGSLRPSFGCMGRALQPVSTGVEPVLPCRFRTQIAIQTEFEFTQAGKCYSCQNMIACLAIVLCLLCCARASTAAGTGTSQQHLGKRRH